MTAWHHQHLETVTCTAGECVQSLGSQRCNAAHRLLHVYRTTCTSANAGGPLALLACLVQQASNGSPSGIASPTATWKEAWGRPDTAQNAIGPGDWMWLQYVVMMLNGPN